jgi:hypothetical protein
MILASWENRSIEEMLEFIQQNLPGLGDLRYREEGDDADTLLRTVQEMSASLARIEQDIRELRQKLGIA